MAKALFGSVGSPTHDRGQGTRLVAENARLRARVADLEALAVRLAEENDQLVAAQADQMAADQMAADQMLDPSAAEMQPA